MKCPRLELTLGPESSGRGSPMVVDPALSIARVAKKAFHPFLGLGTPFKTRLGLY